ncbi:MAG TPA: AMP-binding protein, partial [Solirubrobacterales bacterium]|nr:AMP-binding protein [Solirubrobacterales bacterium]
VFQTMIVLEPAAATPDPSWSLHQMDSLLADAVGGHKLDLELQLDERDDGRLVGRLIYDRDLFEPAGARRFAAHFGEICAAVAGEPDARAAAVPMLTEPERRRQLVEWNATAVERPAGSVAELVAARAAERPEAIAVIEGETTVDYPELGRRAAAVAGSLREAGVGAGDVVALLARPSVDLVVGALGIVGAGAAHLLLDPALPADRLDAVLRDAGVRATLGEGLTLSEGPAPRAGGAGLEGACAVQYADPAAAEPLGVVVGGAAVVNVAAALAEAVELGAEGAALMVGPSVYRAPAIALWMPLLAGTMVVAAPAEDDGAAVGALIGSAGVDFLAAPPGAWETLIGTGLRPSRSLRGLIFGEELPIAVVDAARARCRVLWSAYGPATGPGACTLGRVEGEEMPTAGWPIANTRAYVLDRDGRPASVGVDGELLVAGESLVAGFVGRPELSAETFFDDPFAAGTCCRTGDLAAWLPDGRLRLRPR